MKSKKRGELYILEEAYRRYARQLEEGRGELPPWPQAEINEIVELIKRRLAARGLAPWSEELEAIGDKRAEAAINELGPLLFPLISKAEVRLTGTRPILRTPELKEYAFREADRYEVVGKVASTQVAEVAEHFFRALPEGYVTKKKELVLTVLDEFTNSVSRENVTDSEIQGISNAMLIGMEDGHFTYHELDLILTLMHNAAQSPVHNP